jgi:hypothetical protein
LLGELESDPFHRDHVILADRPYRFDAADVVEIDVTERCKGTLRLLRPSRQEFVVAADVLLPQVSVGLLDTLRTRDPELVDQPVLQCAVHPLFAVSKAHPARSV